MVSHTLLFYNFALLCFYDLDSEISLTRRIMLFYFTKEIREPKPH